jgi:hypothetical protein
MMWLAAAIFMVGVAGFTLLIVGLRGRLASTHPHCRRCRFDLVGQQSPEGTWSGRVCPECGSDLGAPRAIRRGIRAVRRPALLAGITLLLLVGFIGGGTVWAAMQGSPVYAKLPTWVLVGGLGWLEVPQVDAIAAELRARALAGQLSDDQWKSIVRSCLGIQADARIAWTSQLGKLIEEAHNAGKTTPEMWEEYLDNAAALSAVVRPRIARGDPLPIELRIHDRIGRTGSIGIQLRLVDVLVDGVRIDGERQAFETTPNDTYAGSSNPPYQTMLVCPNSRALLPWSSGAPPSQWKDAVVDCEPGVHAVETVWAVVAGVTDSSGGGGNSASWQHAPPPGPDPPRRSDEQIIRQCKVEWLTHSFYMPDYAEEAMKRAEVNAEQMAALRGRVVRLTSKVKVVPAGATLCRMSAPTPQPDGTLAGFSVRRQVMYHTSWQEGPPYPAQKLEISIQSPMPAIAGEFFEIAPNGEIDLGSVSFEPSRSTPEVAHGYGTTLPVTLTGDSAKPRTFVFRPTASAATHLVDGEEILGAEVWFRDVPAAAQDNRGWSSQKPTPGQVAPTGQAGKP